MLYEPDFSGEPAPGPFADGPDRKIFRFTYRGAPQPLRSYLLQRYAFGRDAQWRESFYPGRVRLNGGPVDAGTAVASGDRLQYLHLRSEEPSPPALGPPLYEDRWMLVLNKPDTIPVNPSGVYYFTCLALLAREVLGYPSMSPLHRLDLETAGPVIFAKRAGEARHFHRLFEEHRIEKRYRALVHGAFPATTRELRGCIGPHPDSAIHTKLALVADGPGRQVLTRVMAVGRRGKFSEVELEPVTGRTNQLRVQLAAAGHPIVGDKKYHPDEGVFLDWLEHRDFERLRARLLLPRQALLCERLSFAHPFTGRPLTLHAPAGAWRRKTAGLDAVTGGHRPPGGAPL